MAPLDKPQFDKPPLDKPVQISTEAVTLRRARREDIPAIDVMHALSVRALGANDYTAQEIAVFLHSLGTYDPTLIDDGTYFVMEHAGRVVGSGGWSLRLPHGGARGAERFSLSPHSAKIRSIFVHPGYARLGLGSRLARHAEGEAAAAGHRLLELWSSLTAVPLYRRLGYQAVAPMAIPCADGAALPAVHMAKLMPATDASAA